MKTYPYTSLIVGALLATAPLSLNGNSVQLIHEFDVPIHDYGDAYGPDSSFVFHQGDAYLSYGLSLYRIPGFPARTDLVELELPIREPDWNLGEGLKGSGYSLFSINNELFVYAGLSTQSVDHPDLAMERLFRLDPETGRYTHVGQFLLAEDSMGFRYNPITMMQEANGRIYANPGKGNNLAVAESVTGEWTTVLGDLNQRHGTWWGWYIEDHLAINYGWSGWMFGAFYRGQLDETFIDWAQEPEMSDEVAALLEYREVRSVARNPATGTLMVSAREMIMRSLDDGITLPVVLRSPHLVPGEEGVNWPEDDLSLMPFIRHTAFPTEHGGYVVVAGHEAHDGVPYARPFLAWSQDDGQTWENLTDMIPDWQEPIRPLVSLVSAPDGTTYVGQVISGEQVIRFFRLDLPDPVAEAFPLAEKSEGGWRDSPTLGWLYTANYPWIWTQEQQAWQYAMLSTTEFGDLWLWDAALGWAWTTEGSFPLVYSFDHDSFLHYARSSGPQRWFYDFAQATWIAFPASD